MGIQYYTYIMFRIPNTNTIIHHVAGIRYMFTNRYAIQNQNSIHIVRYFEMLLNHFAFECVV